MTERPLRVLQVNRADLVGRRFNNFDAASELAKHGIESRMLVWDRKSDRPDVMQLFQNPALRRMNSWLTQQEAKRNIHGRYQLHSYLLAFHPWFRWADVVHYHIIHDLWFSLDAMPFLSRQRPTLWTWHDPWIMTGHCIYPLECGRWRIGCGQCPALDRPFAMTVDRSAEQHGYKRELLKQTRTDVILASRHMMDMAEASPIAQGKRLHYLPLGIDLNAFKQVDGSGARERFRIRPDRLVISFRAAGENPFKGVAPLLAAINRLPSNLPPLCLLTTHGRGVAYRWLGRHQVVELGWVDDERTLINSILAADIVVIPSLGEAFGMMAIEAMACGKPVIVGDGTALPEVSGAPKIGLVANARDSDDLARAITHLVLNPQERAERGAAGRKMAESHYGLDRYAASLAAIYRDVAVRYRR